MQEIKTSLPEPKYVSSNKIISRLNKVFETHSKDKIEKAIMKERPKVKEFVTKAYEGEYLQLPPKVANIIAQHLEGSVS